MEKAFFPIPFGRKMLKSGTDLTSGIDRRMYGMERGGVVEKAFFPILFGRKTSCMPLLYSCTKQNRVLTEHREVTGGCMEWKEAEQWKKHFSQFFLEGKLAACPYYALVLESAAAATQSSRQQQLTFTCNQCTEGSLIILCGRRPDVSVFWQKCRSSAWCSTKADYCKYSAQKINLYEVKISPKFMISKSAGNYADFQ